VSFRLYLLPLLVIGSPLIFAYAIYRVRQALGRNAQESPTQQSATRAARRTYFYPTRELDGNDAGYYGTEL
jgi:hypothetical protein